MKVKINNYTFDSSVGVITFNDYTQIRKYCILLIVNTSSGVIMYNFTDPDVNGTVVNNHIILNLDTTQLSGVWSGTVYFEASVDGQVWANIIGVVIGSSTASSYSTSLRTNPIRFNTVGLKYIRFYFSSYSSGHDKITAILSQVLTPTIQITSGSQGFPFMQRSSGELNTVDTSVGPATNILKDILSPVEPWNTYSTYYVGDTVLYKGQVWICTLQLASANSSAYFPYVGSSYWALDPRQNKSASNG